MRLKIYLTAILLLAFATAIGQSGSDGSFLYQDPIGSGLSHPRIYFVNKDSNVTVRVRFAGVIQTVQPRDTSRGYYCFPFSKAGGYSLYAISNNAQKLLIDVPVPDNAEYISETGEWLLLISFDKTIGAWSASLVKKDKQETREELMFSNTRHIKYVIPGGNGMADFCY